MNCYIVTLISRMDDLVHSVHATREEAERVGASLTEADADPLAAVYNYDVSEVIFVKIVEVRDGKLHGVTICKDFEQE